MTTSEALLRDGIRRQDGETALTLDPLFQGLPDTAHGGTVLAAFLAAAAPDGGGPGSAAIRGAYRRRVPLGVPLSLRLAPDATGVACQLLEVAGPLLVDGRVHLGPAAAAAPGRPPAPPPAGAPLPVSARCFACGVDNPVGLQARLGFDDVVVAGRWPPRDTSRTADGMLAPLALTALLDEVAFWLGALASGESGMTTELDVRLGDPVAFGEAITVVGPRAAVRQRPDDPRYWDAQVQAVDDTGRPVAEAAITFVAVRGAARRLLAALSPLNPPEVLARVFPAYH
jgi:hypothetical protein